MRGVGLWKTAEQGVRFRRAENCRSRRDIGAIVPAKSRFALGVIADAACQALRFLCGRLRRGKTPLHRGGRTAAPGLLLKPPGCVRAVAPPRSFPPFCTS